jgi:hypothetical protein
MGNDVEKEKEKGIKERRGEERRGGLSEVSR